MDDVSIRNRLVEISLIVAQVIFALKLDGRPIWGY